MRSAIDNALFRLGLRPWRTKRVGTFRVAFANGAEFARLRQEVFADEEYGFEADTPAPYILDCGAHIGLSILYFKGRYPKARIVAFEPNPDVFRLLWTNVRRNRLTDVDLVHAAVADHDGAIDFWAPEGGTRQWTWGGAVVRQHWHNEATHRRISVPAVRLSTYIDRPVDFLKLDIEGIEGKVLAEIEDALGLVKEIALEFHGSSTNQENDLDGVLGVLERAGFTPTLAQEQRPVDLAELERTDPLWLNIHARRT